MMNPMQLIQFIRGGGNPTQMLMQASQQNPVVGQVIRMTNGKTPEQMRSIVYETAQARGVDINQLAQQMGIKLPG